MHILRFTNQQVIESVNLVLNSIAEKIEDIEDLKDLRKAKEESKNEPCYSLEQVKQMLNIE